MEKKKAQPRGYRNRVALAPIMGKSHAHGSYRSRKRERSQSRQALRRGEF